MKTYATFGFAMALGGALLSLALYFLGYHSDPEKLGAAQWIGSIGGLGIGVACITLGVKARRSEIPASESFGYGRALAAGVMISLFASIIGIFTNYLYFHVINPGFSDLIMQAQMAKMEAAGRSAAQMEQAEKGMRFFMSPILQSLVGFVIGFFWATIISLIVAAFLKREATEEISVV